MNNKNYTMAFTKVKINEKKTEVHYVKHVKLPEDVQDEKGYRNVIIPMESEVKPHNDFFEAFQDLKKFAIPYMEMSQFKNKVDKKILEKFTVTTVSIKEDLDTVKIQVSMNKYLESGKCFSVTSPLIDLEEDEFSEIEDFRGAYWHMIGEAKEYLKGKNGEAQLKIEFEAA